MTGYKLRTLKKRADFLRARNGRYFAAKGLVLQVMRKQDAERRGGGDESSPPAGEPDSQKDTPRFGFTATKKLGNAVVRSRVKRRLREAVRRIAPQKARNGFDYVLIGRQDTRTRAFEDLLGDLSTAFDKVHERRRPRAKKPRSGKNQRPGGRRKAAARPKPDMGNPD